MGTNKSSEWKRGYNWGKKYYSKFRSFKKRSDGTFIGYKKSGGTEVLGSLGQHRAIKGFHGGAYTSFKEHVKARPTKTRKNSTKKSKSIFDMTMKDLF